MSKGKLGNLIRLRGVRQNNLKNFDLDLPTGRLIVVTGLSGSGKSSLAFETLYAEGQRRYIETFSPYARQFLDRMDKPRVDSIQGIPPAIAIEQRNAVKSTRSTVGTMTEICDYMKSVWAHISQLHCRQCGRPVRKDSPGEIWEDLSGDGAHAGREVLIVFELPLSEKLSLDESLGLIANQGYQRLLAEPGPGQGSPSVIRLEEAARLFEAGGCGTPKSLRLVQDRVRIVQGNRARFVEACEQAYHFGKGKLEVRLADQPSAPRRFSSRFHCAECDLDYAQPSPALFSFNHPVGACPTCRGFGRTITIDYALAIPDPSLTLAKGAVKPWQSGQSAECQRDLMQFCRKRGAPVDTPFQELSPEWQRWVMEGDEGYGKDKQHEWPNAWYGIKGYFRWLESRTYKMHVRVLLSRYRAYRTCPDCGGCRFQPDALLFKRATDSGKSVTLADFYSLPVAQAFRFIESVAAKYATVKHSDPLKVVLDEVRSRLGYLVQVGLGYLTLDRPTRSLSGGETERVNLTTCLGSRLVNTLFVLDEPTVGLHPRDTERLIGILRRLRDAGNTVLVVEHEASVMRAADKLVDLGPGHGETGGQLIFQGTYDAMLASADSLTGQYLSGKRCMAPGVRRPGPGAIGASSGLPKLKLRHATRHNLRDLNVEIPLGRFVCVTGVSGSGKTTLIREVLLPILQAKLSGGRFHQPTVEGEEGSEAETSMPPAGMRNSDARISGWENVGQVVLMDQSPIGRTPRSNPGVYIEAFEFIRQLFAKTEAARRHGLTASAFSFNSRDGQCEQCGGAGFEKIEMQFLSDVYVRCPGCRGRRYRQHILDVKIPWKREVTPQKNRADQTPGFSGKAKPSSCDWSIADALEATIEENIEFLRSFAGSRLAGCALGRLQHLIDVGLGYLRLGQPINTLSGGESQRLKLATHLAQFAAAHGCSLKPALFMFDEPTTGLHFEDVRLLINVFHKLVQQGQSLIVVEHNLDLIKAADWIIDLGPDAGDAGGELVVQGTPEQVAACPTSHTGRSLRDAGVQSAS